jgi:protein-tyrosine phosphatase
MKTGMFQISRGVFSSSFNIRFRLTRIGEQQAYHKGRRIGTMDSKTDTGIAQETTMRYISDAAETLGYRRKTSGTVRYNKIIISVLCLIMLMSMTSCNTTKQDKPADETGQKKGFVSTEEAVIGGHFIKLEGSENTRDLGGYTAKNGKTINRGVFIRSGRISRLSDADQKILFEDTGIDCVIDFRSDREVAAEPDKIPDSCEYYRIVFENSPPPAEGIPRLLDSYKAMIKSTDKIKEVMEIFADPNHKAILYHCTAGKDRTGIISMLLLEIAGIDGETILNDYSDSDKLLINLTAEFMEINPDTPIEYMLSDASTLIALYEYIEADYGSISEYLNEIGVTEEMQNQIRAKMFS